MKYNFGELETFLKEKGLSPIEYEKYLRPLKRLNNTVRCGLVWEEPNEESYETENSIAQLRENFPFLKELEDKRLSYSGIDNVNLLIEGDNYHALKALQYTHKGMIDVIYIDPPYNTGKEFVYNDKIVDPENEWRHSKWLSVMNKRLRLARELMTEDGVIFISIDDNEQANLKLLCDSVFSENNFIGMLIQDKGNAQNDADNIQRNHEYILVYANRMLKENGKSKRLLEAISDESKPVLFDGKNYYIRGSELTSGQQNSDLNHHSLCGYTIYWNEKTNDIIPIMDYDTEKAKNSNDEKEIYKPIDKELLSKGYVAIRPKKRGSKLGRWTWSYDKFVKEKDIIGIACNRGFSVFKKEFVSEKELIEIDGKKYYKKSKNEPSKSIIAYSTANGTKALKEIFNDKTFDNPKNVEMIKYLISLYFKKNIIILDFYAGSGTTGQAVLELNEEDGGNRKFILCTNNELSKSERNQYLISVGCLSEEPSLKGSSHKEWEKELSDLLVSEEFQKIEKTEEYQNKGICRAVTYPRLKTVITGIRQDDSKYSDGLPSNLNFYVIDLEKDHKDDRRNKNELIDKCTDLISIKENCFCGKEKGEFKDDHASYELIFGENKVVLLLEKAQVYDYNIDDAIDILEKRAESEKVIYSSYEGYSEYYHNSIVHHLLPQEVIEVLKLEGGY